MLPVTLFCVVMHLAAPGKAAALVKGILPLLAPEAKKRVDSWNRKRVFRQDVTRAFEDFLSDPVHQHVAPTFFDGTFLEVGAAPLLATFLNERGRMASAEDLVAAWNRYGIHDDTEKAQASAAARAFLGHLERRLKQSALFDVLFDSRALDRAAEAAESVEQMQKELHESMRHKDVVAALILVKAAARSYRAAGRTVETDPETAARLADDGDATFEDGVMNLRAARFQDIDGLENTFSALIRSTFDDLDAAVAGGHLTKVLRDNCERGFDVFLEYVLELAAP